MGRPPKSNLPNHFLALLRQIGANLELLRKKKRFTQAELSRRSGISITTVNEIETRQCRDIRLSTLYALSGALEVPPLRLLTPSDLELTRRDQAQLLKASETILQITAKLR